MAAGDILTVQGSITPNKACYSLIGGDNDAYAAIDAFTQARVAANDTTGTFTAWVMMASDMLSSTQTVIGNGDANVVEFLDISVETGLLTVRITDNTTAQLVTQADASHFLPYVWHQIAVVQAADGYGPKLYVDGQKIAATNDTATDVNSWYAELDGLDSGLIGASNKSGNDSITQEFKGFIGPVKYWNSALTAEQIEQEYKGNTCGVTPTAYFLDQESAGFCTPLTYVPTLTNECYIVSGGNPFALLVKNPPSGSAPVVADEISISISGDTGTAVIVKAA